MATFRSAVGTLDAGPTSEITITLPAGMVAGDLIVIFTSKRNTDRPVVPDDWFELGFFQHGIGTRLSSMAAWTIATAALISTGSVDVVCTSSSNDSQMQAVALAFDISDWPGVLWNTSDFLHATSGTTKDSSSLATIFAGGISLVFHAVGVVTRTAPGTTTEGGVAFDNADTEIVSVRVWYNVAETAELAQVATVGGAGTINATQVGFACFGPSQSTQGTPCPDPDGTRTGF